MANKPIIDEFGDEVDEFGDPIIREQIMTDPEVSSDEFADMTGMTYEKSKPEPYTGNPYYSPEAIAERQSKVTSKLLPEPKDIAAAIPLPLDERDVGPLVGSIALPAIAAMAGPIGWVGLAIAGATGAAAGKAADKAYFEGSPFGTKDETAIDVAKQYGEEALLGAGGELLGPALRMVAKSLGKISKTVLPDVVKFLDESVDLTKMKSTNVKVADAEAAKLQTALDNELERLANVGDPTDEAGWAYLRSLEDMKDSLRSGTTGGRTVATAQSIEELAKGGGATRVSESMKAKARETANEMKASRAGFNVKGGQPASRAPWTDASGLPIVTGAGIDSRIAELGDLLAGMNKKEYLTAAEVLADKLSPYRQSLLRGGVNLMRDKQEN